MLNLVSREEWGSEDDTTRLEDLVDLSNLVVHAADPDGSKEAMAFLTRTLVGTTEQAVNLRVELGAADQAKLETLVARIEDLAGASGGGEPKDGDEPPAPRTERAPPGTSGGKP